MLKAARANPVFISGIAAGEEFIGIVGAPDKQVGIVPTLDVVAYTAGDVLFLETELADAARISSGTMILHSVKVIDLDDQGIEMDIHFFDRAVTFGAKNGVPSISDADVAYWEGKINVPSGSYDDLGGAKVADVAGNGLGMHANVTSLFVAAVTQGAPTHTVGGLVLKFYFIRA